MYKINQNEMDSSFRIPSSIVDKHIRLANEHQLKVLLWIMRNSPDNPDIEKMCSDLRINPEDASDYLQYWVLTGVLLKDGAPAPVSQMQSQVTNQPFYSAPADFEKPAPVREFTKPTQSEIAIRLSESKEIASLFKEAQVKFGKTIGYEMQCTLLMLFDYDGLPVEVIYMLIDYCVSIGKINSGYIAAVGHTWGADEIDTIEKADEKISSLRRNDVIWKEFAAMAGISHPRPTTKQSEYLKRWSEQFNFDNEVIFHAYEEMADHTQKFNFAYMDKILSSWHSDGARNIREVKALQSAALEAKKSAVKKPKEPKRRKPSYNVEAFQQAALDDDLKYERKKKQ